MASPPAAPPADGWKRRRTAGGGSDDEVCVLTLGGPADGDALAELWASGALTDVVLRAGDGAACEPLPCHRVVLASASPFFRALFAGSRVWADAAAPTVTLRGVDGDTLRALVGAVYTRRLEVSPATVAPLLAGAAQLALAAPAGALLELLRQRLCPASALATAALACAHGAPALAAQAEACAAAHFAAVLQEDPHGFSSLPPDRLAALLASDALAVPSEADALRALLAWAAAPPPQAASGEAQAPPTPASHLEAMPRHRAHHLAALLPLVRLRLVPRPALLEAAEEASQLGAPDAAALLRRVAGVADGAPSWRPRGEDCAPLCGDEVDDDSISGGARSSCCPACAAAAAAAAAWHGGAASRWAAPRAATSLRLLVAGGHDPAWRGLRSCELYDLRAQAWAPAPPLPAPMAFAGGARVGGALVAVSGGTFASCAARAPLPPPAAAWDEPAALPWSQAPPPPTPRAHAAMAAVEAAVYLLGGRVGANAVSDVVERYDPERDAWDAAPPRMRTPRASLGAAALGGTLFAVGGQAGRETFATCDALDIASARWLPAPTLHAPRKYAAVAPLHGRVLALGGMDGMRCRTATCEALDPREGRWRPIAPLPTPRSSAAAAAAAGALFVAGGSDGDATLASAARYDAAADAWEEIGSMAAARSGAALVAL